MKVPNRICSQLEPFDIMEKYQAQIFHNTSMGNTILFRKSRKLAFYET